MKNNPNPHMAAWKQLDPTIKKNLILALQTDFRLQNKPFLQDGYVMQDALWLLILEELQVQCIDSSHDTYHEIARKDEVYWEDSQD